MHAKTWRTWTAKERRRLEELRLEGRTAAAIAGILGRSLASIKCRLAQEQIRRPLQIGRWLAVLMQPHTIEGAAREMGTTKWAVKQAKRKLRRAGWAVPDAQTRRMQ